MIAVPADDILLKYVSGVLDPALRLLVDLHLGLHPQTQARLAAFEQFAGLALAAETGAALTAGSLDRALARINQASADAVADLTPFVLPPAEQLDWRWAGPGRAIANIEVPGSQHKMYGLRIAPGKAMLQHSHAAEEWTLILKGSYRDEGGDYAAGAFITEDDETDHRPVATGDTDCICLAVMSGPLVAPGLMGKAARWLMG